MGERMNSTRMIDEEISKDIYKFEVPRRSNSKRKTKIK